MSSRTASARERMATTAATSASGRGGEGRGEAEACHGRPAGAVDEDVVEPEIAVHDAPSVRVGDGLADLKGDIDRPARGAGQRARERPPGGHLRDDVALASLGPDRDEREDVRVPEPEERPELALEEGVALAGRLARGGQEPDGDPAAGAAVAGAVDDPEHVAGDLVLELERPVREDDGLERPVEEAARARAEPRGVVRRAAARAASARSAHRPSALMSSSISASTSPSSSTVRATWSRTSRRNRSRARCRTILNRVGLRPHAAAASA